MNRQDIIEKFGDDYLASERTFRMGIDRRLTSFLAERFRGRVVLESCTGAGFSTIALARVAAAVFTIEIDPDVQAQARANLRKAGLEKRVRFLTGDAMDRALLDRCCECDAAFLDPDWAVRGPEHVFRFSGSNTEPPADALLEAVQGVTPHVALVLPPLVDPREFAGLPPHERQSLFLGQSHELFCLFFGDLARSAAPTEFRATV